MSETYFDAVIAYKSAAEEVACMVNRGFISPREQANIDTILRKKYGITSCSLWVKQEWISGPTRGNM